MKKIQRKQICQRIKVELNSKLIQIAEYEDMSKNKLIEKDLEKMVAEWERTHPGALQEKQEGRT